MPLQIFQTFSQFCIYRICPVDAVTFDRLLEPLNLICFKSAKKKIMERNVKLMIVPFLWDCKYYHSRIEVLQNCSVFFCVSFSGERIEWKSKTQKPGLRYCWQEQTSIGSLYKVNQTILDIFFQVLSYWL